MKIEQCRICGNTQLIPIGSLGDIAISDFTDTPSEGQKYPLELVYCEECTLLQLAHNTPRDLLYKHYWYQSHLNPVIVADLKEIASLVKGNSVCDIGANDLTMLKFVPKTIERLAVDPAKNFSTVDGIESHLSYWETFEHFEQFDTITAIACLYDLPDPNAFMQNVKEFLSKDGLFICQLMTLQPMIENNDVGNICHEHLEYYSYKSMVRLFEQNGLEIFKVETNNMNGGSYRLFARHYQKGSIDYQEKEYGVKELKAFFDRIEENKKMMAKFWGDGNHIYGYGASTKANTILQYYGKPNLKGIVDINPLKIDKYMVNSQIPIINKIPDDCEYLWVFPYGFIDYFKEKEKGYKGKWITTIPKFEIC